MAYAEVSSLLDDFFQVMESESRLAAVDKYLASDASVCINGDTVSVSRYRDRLRQQDRRLEVTNVRVRNRMTDGSVIAANAELTFRHTGRTYGIEPSDTTIESSVSAFHEFDDGQIVDLDIVYDGSQTLRELGLLSENPVTEKLRDQYYEVLNRVLRHNLRNDLNVVSSAADLLRREQTVDSTSVADEIEHTIDGLLATVEKAQQLERLAIDDSLSVDAVDVAGVVDRVGQRHADGSLNCHCEHQSLAVTTDRRLLENLLSEVVENAIEHTPESVSEVDVAFQPSSGNRHAVEISVSDDGPGIPDSELRPVLEDDETKLLHGSGIGLWVLKWCVTRLEGDLSFDTEDGTTVEIRLPDLG